MQLESSIKVGRGDLPEVDRSRVRARSCGEDERYEGRKGALRGRGQHRGLAGRNSQHLGMRALSVVLVGGAWLLNVGCGTRPAGLHGNTGLH